MKIPCFAGWLSWCRPLYSSMRCHCKLSLEWGHRATVGFSCEKYDTILSETGIFNLYSDMSHLGPRDLQKAHRPEVAQQPNVHFSISLVRPRSIKLLFTDTEHERRLTYNHSGNSSLEHSKQKPREITNY